MIMPNSMSATPVQQSMIMNNFANFNNSISQPQFQGPWTITAQEHQQNEEQFMILHPSNGLIGGEQARPFFLKSGLPSNVLAQIWQISDLNKDGKLDRLEFTIAMKLVKNCLAGLPLPPTLPDSMRQIIGMTSSYFGGSVPPAPFGNFPSSNGGGAAMPMPPRPLSTHGSMPSIASSSQRSYGSYSAAPTPTGVGGAPPFLMGIKELGDWSMPQPLKLRFSQQFNQLDRSRIGLLTGQQARGVLGESQLPTHILAQIWNMSDVNKDGCLSIEEFCIAKFLIEMVKNGYALPPKLPNELYAFCHRSKTASPSTVGLSEAADPNAPPPQKPGHGQFKSFEDKRRDNLDKGQAELERRRQILREEEERRHAEIERREREEAERKERERQELERRREAEMEAERQREMIRERERAVEEDRLKAEREETRRRLEQERIRELEKIRIRDLENQLQAETEKSTQIQQRHRTMAFQLQALDERSQQLNGEITEARNTILGITQEIEGMRGQRDQKMARIGELERGSKEIIVQSERFSHENLQLQSEFQRQLSRVNEIDTLRREIGELDETIQIAEEQKEAIKERSKNQEKLVTEKRPDWDQSCQGIQNVENVYMELLGKYNLARTAAGAAPTPQTAAPNGAYEMPPDAVFGSIACRRTSQTGSAAGGFDNDFNSDFSTFGRPSLEREASLDKIDLQPLASMNGGAPNAAKQPIQANNEQPGLNTSAVKTVKYRALFEFNARSNDELTLQPGDVVLVFEGHQSEPGWLAGQIRDKVGWFPAAFAEPMSLGTNRAQEPLKKGASLTGSPSGEPLASIKEEGEMPSLTPGAIVTEPKIEERAQFKADFTSAFSKSISLNDTTPAGIDAQLKPMGSMSTSISAAGALYDLPPTEEPIAQKTIENAATNSSGDRIQAASGPMYELPPGDDGKVVTNETTPDEHRVLAVGTALYQWKARNEQEMSFARGDTIEVIEQAEMRWKGRLQKNRKVQGWFPKSYVKLSASASDKLPKTQEQIGNGKQQNGVEHLPFAEGQGAAVCQDNGEWFVALYQFDAVESTDLSLKPGDRIWVIDQRDEWWKGTHGGRTGIFPANYVQKIAEEHQEKVVTMSSTAVEIKHTIGRAIAAFEATASNQISLAPGDIVKVHQTTPGGWWEGELERDGEKHSGWFPGNYIQVLPPEDGKVLATAAFDYAAQHDDELSFKAGEIIEVVERIDSQWWKGKKHGQQDQQVPLLFPANFVQLKSLTP